MKRPPAPTEREKIFANVSQEKSIFRMYKELLEFSNESKNE